MARQIFWILVAVIVGGILFSWWIVTQNGAAPQSTATTTTVETLPENSVKTANASPGSSIPTAVTVTYDGDTFSPQNVTVALGGTVQWVATSGDVWVASDPHDLHNGYDGTTMEQHCALGYSGAVPFDECAAGSSYTFTFEKVGTWAYHDHLNDTAEGSVTVVAQ